MELAHVCPACGGTHCTFKSDKEWKDREFTLETSIAAIVERTKAEPDYRSREVQ